jgi:hypothetical protein
MHKQRDTGLFLMWVNRNRLNRKKKFFVLLWDVGIIVKIMVISFTFDSVVVILQMENGRLFPLFSREIRSLTVMRTHNWADCMFIIIIIIVIVVGITHLYSQWSEMKWNEVFKKSNIAQQLWSERARTLFLLPRTWPYDTSFLALHLEPRSYLFSYCFCCSELNHSWY